MSKSRFFYLRTNGHIFGPFAAPQLLGMYKSGKIKSQDMISPDKVTWQSALEFFEPEKAAALKISEKKTEDKPVLIPIESDQQDYLIRKSSPGGTAGVFALMLTLAAIFMVIICFVFKPVEISENTEIEGDENIAYSEDKTADHHEDNGDVPEKNVGRQETPALGKKNSLQDIIKQNKHAVGVIIARITKRDDGLFCIPVGTAWAYNERSFVTNAHVALGCRDTYKRFRNNPNVKKFDIVIALNESQKICIAEGVKIHPEYISNRDGSDFAMFFVKDKVANFLECASKNELYNLQQGDEIFYLGFPMEGLKNGNLNMKSPTATLRDGRISSISDLSFGFGNVEDNILIRHDLPTVGGASGSPIFSASGKVVAILNAGNMNFKFDDNGRYLGREPSAAQVNFAIRIDRLDGCRKINFMHVDDFLER